MLSITYKTTDCFWKPIERTDVCDNEGEEELRKAFRVLEDNAENAMHNENRCLWWDSYEDYDNKILTERVWTSTNSYDERRECLPKIRREWIARRAEQEA